MNHFLHQQQPRQIRFHRVFGAASCAGPRRLGLHRGRPAPGGGGRSRQAGGARPAVFLGEAKKRRPFGKRRPGPAQFLPWRALGRIRLLVELFEFFLMGRCLKGRCRKVARGAGWFLRVFRSAMKLLCLARRTRLLWLPGSGSITWGNSHDVKRGNPPFGHTRTTREIARNQSLLGHRLCTRPCRPRRTPAAGASECSSLRLVHGEGPFGSLSGSK